MTQSSAKPATWFWVVAAIALVWNLMGVMAYLGQVMMTPEAFELLAKDQQALIESTPAWATGAFAIAVWGGTFGTVLLLLRKKLAVPVLILSFIGILVQLVHAFFISNSFEVFGPGGLIMPVMVFGFALYLIVFARNAVAKGWIS